MAVINTRSRDVVYNKEEDFVPRTLKDEKAVGSRAYAHVNETRQEGAGRAVIWRFIEMNPKKVVDEILNFQ